MRDLAVLVPSRGRPHNIARLLKDFAATNTTATLVLALDSDDATLEDYLALDRHHYWRDTQVFINERTTFGMVQAVNNTIGKIVEQYRHIAFIGDDVAPRTPRWDIATITVLDQIGTGIAYWNDLYNGRDKPTHWAVTRNIIEAFGFFAPPTLTHLYVDDFYQHLGNDLGSLHYLPGVVMEHLHPLYHKSPTDESYQLTNSPAVYVHDHDALKNFLASDTYRNAVLALKHHEGNKE